MLADLLTLKLNPAMEKRFFEAISGISNGTMVDLPTYSRAVVALERISSKESRRIAFAMFDPIGNGRLAKPEFRKALLDLTSDSPSSNDENKQLIQTMVDSCFAEFCSDEKLGMTFEEWLNFAVADPDTCMLLVILRSKKKKSERLAPEES